MSDSEVEEGIYAISHHPTTRMVIETRGGKAVINQFVGSKFQQWKIAKAVGQSYTIRNVGTQMYLGMSVGERVRDGYKLVEVEHAFPWDIRPEDYIGRATGVFLYVPYTGHVIDMYSVGEPIPGASVILDALQEDCEQMWWLTKDLHLATQRALQSGASYKIKRVECQIAITIDEGRAVCFREGDAVDLQEFIPIETEQGWAFQAAESALYLGLPTLVGPFPDEIQVTLVEKAFTWIVLPSAIYTHEFKLWVPYTSYVIDSCSLEPQNNSPVHVCEMRSGNCQWWTFEPVNAQCPGESSKRVTGPRESKR
ncbi:hypothetical protein BKA70DRAFT_1343754 [Coprinopsis sp. MPI-PUGE-AT-0042]|nr:hypothetical protein BKA70DRAFT_1343754 [Coprinopsis sp. MPI-PUGE-AT-0042]